MVMTEFMQGWGGSWQTFWSLGWSTDSIYEDWVGALTVFMENWARALTVFMEDWVGALTVFMRTGLEH
jgi:hypothetical protein